jgi:DNA-binding MarR family transcriptional regulator
MSAAAPSPTAPPESDLAARLRLVLMRSARRLRQEGGTGLSPSQTAALATLRRHGAMPPSELAEREQVKRPTAARLLGRLEEAGLVERRPNPADGRSSLVALTARGDEVLAEARARRTAFLHERLDGLPPEDRAALERAADVLERLLDVGEER